MTLRRSLGLRLADEGAERVRRNHDQRIDELQQLPAASLGIIPNVALPDAVAITIAHKLGRRPAFVRESSPRGATTSGRIDDVTDDSVDRTKFVVLKASGWGATITVDVQVL